MKKKDSYIKELKQAFKSEESTFKLTTCLKIASIFLMGLAVCAFIVVHFIEWNYLFLRASGFPGEEELKGAYFAFVTKDLLPRAPLLLGYFVALFFSGAYISSLLLRPFREISKYCLDHLDGRKAEYNPSQFSSLSLVRDIGQYFFQYVEMSLKEKRWLDNILPDRFLGVRKAPLEKTFFLHFILIFGLICGLTTALLYITVTEIHQQIIELSLAYLKDLKSIQVFLKEQDVLLESTVSFGLAAMIILYLLLAYDLFNKVSGAGFAIFSTFRSYLKGDHSAQIHMIGFNYLRGDTRIINKYLRSLEIDMKEVSQGSLNPGKNEVKLVNN